MKNRLRRLLPALCAVAIPVTLMTACSGSSSVGSPAGVTTSVAGTLPGASASTGSTSGALSQMRIRVINLFAPKMQDGPALDIYDVQLTGQKATPVATNIAYGAVSQYFTPHVEPNSATPTVVLFALPAGEDPVAKMADAQSVGGAQDDGSHPQLTLILTADTGTTLNTGPLAGLSFSERVETGDEQGSSGPVAPPAPSGQGEIMVDTHAVFDQSAGLYLIVDNSCAPPLNGDSQVTGVPYIFAADGATPASAFALFTASPGSHQVSVVDWSSSVQPSCAQLTAKQGTTTVNVTAGEQIETYVYGTSDTDLHLAFAPLPS